MAISQTFVKNIGNPGIDDGITVLVENNNTLYVAGYSGKQAYLAALTTDGDLLWKQYFKYADSKNYISDLYVNNDEIILCGYGHDTGTTIFEEFFVKFNSSIKKIEWARKTSLNIKPNNIHFYKDNIYVTGDEYANGKFGLCFLSLNEKNGKVNNSKTWYFMGHESASISLIEDDILYSGGRYGIRPKTDKYRASISQFNVNNFDQIQSNYFLNSKQDFARAYLTDMVIEEDSIVALCFSNNSGIDNYYTISLMSTAKNGSVNWSNEYSVKGYTSITARDMLKVADGYIVLGFTKSPNENLLLIKFDKQGYPIYAYELGGKFSDNIILDQGKFLAYNNGDLYLAAQSKNISEIGDYDSFIIKIKEGEAWSDSCFASKEIKLEMKAYEILIEGEIVLAAYDTVFKETNIAYEILNPRTEINSFLCRDVAPKDSISEAYSFENTAFNNTVFLMDASLSMNREDRMPILKKSLFKILNYMRNEDQISVVSYADNATLILNGVSASKDEEIQLKIDSLSSSGQSDIMAGLQMGLKVVEDNFKESSNNRIILTTDGDLSFDKQKELRELLLKNNNNKVIVSIFLFNNSSTYFKQLSDIAAEVGATVFVVNQENIETTLLNELRAKKR
jgi:Mg-chelatase subunit ChlD